MEMRYRGCRVILVILFALILSLQRTEAQGQTKIQLVSARDHIDGSFLGSQAIYADRDRIYLASYQGELYVLARDRSTDFPVLEVVRVSDLPLRAIGGDSRYLYVTSADGTLRIYRKERPLVLIGSVRASDYELNSLALIGPKVYVSAGQASLAADSDHVYVSRLNESDLGLEIGKKTSVPGVTYGETFEPNTTEVFDRKSGERISGITNPSDMRGLLSQVSIYVDAEVLVQTIPGCCGPGIFIYDPGTFVMTQSIPDAGANAVIRWNELLVAGNEGGQVKVFDLEQNPSPLVSAADLRQLTGHTGSEDIEIRALWKDDWDNLVFAASSWGNDQSRSPSLPSFFVLELVKQ